MNVLTNMKLLLTISSDFTQTNTTGKFNLQYVIFFLICKTKDVMAWFIYLFEIFMFGHFKVAPSGKFYNTLYLEVVFCVWCAISFELDTTNHVFNWPIAVSLQTALTIAFWK